MSVNVESVPILEPNPSPKPPLQLHLQDEFMDVAGRYTFRTHLSGTESDEQAKAIVEENLTEIARSQDGLSNEQLYDELHARLCGPEPMEREQLLAFMKLFIQALWKLIESVAESSLPITTPESPEYESMKETVPDQGLARLSFAKIFPRKVLSFLQAMQQVTTDSQKSGLIFQLFVLAECSDIEISRLLDTTPGKVQMRRIQATDATWNVYETLVENACAT